MSNKTAPILTALVLGAVALSPIFIKSFGNNPQVAHVGNSGSTSGNVTLASDDTAKAGYSLGYMMGANVKRGAKDLSLADIQQGLQDGYNGKDAIMTNEQMEQAVMAYQQRQVDDMKKNNLEKGKQFLAENGKKANIKTTASGLQYEVLKEGNATKPKATDTVSVQYEGKLLDGTVFDSTANHGGEPVSFKLGDVIAGWTEGLQLMGEGASYRFYIPSELAYGEQGVPQGNIEPNSVLIFDVELIKVNPPPQQSNTPQLDLSALQEQLQQHSQSASATAK